VSLLEVRGLVRSFAGVAALDTLSFSLAAGEMVAAAGPSGAGKTTLLDLIAGNTRPTGGAVVFSGGDLGRLAPAARARLGIARSFQDLRLFPGMSLAENVMVGLAGRRGGRLLPALLQPPWTGRAARRARAEATELLAFVGLRGLGEAAVETLDQGAMRRLALARALAARPRLLLLDEPTRGLDAAETRAINAAIAKVATGGIAVLLAVRELRRVPEACGRVLMLDCGVLIAEGEPANLRHEPRVVAAYLGEAGIGHATPPPEARSIDVSGEA